MVFALIPGLLFRDGDEGGHRLGAGHRAALRPDVYQRRFSRSLAAARAIVPGAGVVVGSPDLPGGGGEEPGRHGRVRSRRFLVAICPDPVSGDGALPGIVGLAESVGLRLRNPVGGEALDGFAGGIGGDGVGGRNGRRVFSSFGGVGPGRGFRRSLFLCDPGTDVPHSRDAADDGGASNVSGLGAGGSGRSPRIVGLGPKGRRANCRDPRSVG